eukprot:SAG31_NODE_24395_length_482_cov_1.073107_1_plen_119_part_10
MSNFDRLGRTEVELTNCVIYGADQLVWMERRLESGADIEERVELLARERQETMSNFTYVASSHHANLTKGEMRAFEHTSKFDSSNTAAGSIHQDAPALHAQPPSRYATGAQQPTQTSSA